MYACVYVCMYVCVYVHNIYFNIDDDDCDISFDPDNANQYIVWGIGGLEETAFRHFVRSGSKSHSPSHNNYVTIIPT